VVLANLEVTETLGLSFFRRFSCVATLSALFATLVKAETVIAWHRKGFRLFWNRKVRHGKPGRPRVARDVREGWISRDKAASTYRVVVDGAGRLDAAATASLRGERIAAAAGGE